LADYSRYTLADYGWYTLADSRWYSIARLLTLGILQQSGATMAAPMMAPNGTRFGGWLLNTADNQLGIAGRYAGGPQAGILVTSPWGIGTLTLSGSTLSAPMMQPNGARFGGWLLNSADNEF